MADWHRNVRLPAHGLIKLELWHRLCVFRFAAIGLIEFALRPIRRGASKCDSRRCGWFTNMNRFKSIERPLLAGKRPLRTVASGRKMRSNFGLLGHFQRVIDFDAEIADGTFQFCVSQEQLHCSQVLGSPVD